MLFVMYSYIMLSISTVTYHLEVDRRLQHSWRNKITWRVGFFRTTINVEELLAVRRLWWQWLVFQNGTVTRLRCSSRRVFISAGHQHVRRSHCFSSFVPVWRPVHSPYIGFLPTQHDTSQRWMHRLADSTLSTCTKVDRVTRSLTARTGCNTISSLLRKSNSNLRKYLPCIRYHRHYTTSGDSFLCFSMHYKHHGGM